MLIIVLHRCLKIVIHLVKKEGLREGGSFLIIMKNQTLFFIQYILIQ